MFDATSTYLGWVEDSRVWGSGGIYLGQIVDENYIFRSTVAVPPHPRVPRVPPIPPIPPIPSMNRIGRIPRVGWVDALDDL